MLMIRKIDNYSRIHIFEHYNICDNPFMILTTKVDVTDVVEFCKKNKMFYATLGYLITKTVNDIDSFKKAINDLKIPYEEADDFKMNVFSNDTVTDLIIKLNDYGCIVTKCFNVETSLEEFFIRLMDENDK